MSSKKIIDYPHLNSRQVPEDSYYERRALFKPMNFEDQDLNRPFVAVANSWNEFVLGLQVEISKEVIKEKLKSLEPFESRIKEGFLGGVYTRLVDSVDRGAVLRAR